LRVSPGRPGFSVGAQATTRSGKKKKPRKEALLL
jgi:hypothetical protein